MNRTMGLIPIVGLVTVATAQRNAINTLVSDDGGATWYNTLSLAGGMGMVNVTVGVFYERAGGVGFSGAVHNITLDHLVGSDVITLLDRPDSAQHPDGRQGRFNFGAQRQQAYRVGATGRIAAANNTQDAVGGGISVKQNTPPASGSLFDTSNPAFGFQFELVVDTSTSARQIFIETPANRIANFSIYPTSQSTSGSNQDLGSVELDGASIWVNVPAPSSITALVSSGVVFLSRKRR